MLQLQGNFASVPFSGRRGETSSLGGQRSILASTQEPVELSRESIMEQENSNISNQIDVVSKGCMDIECENNNLRAELVELSERLQSLYSIMEIVEGVIIEIPEYLLNPWQIPHSSQPIMASADIL